LRQIAQAPVDESAIDSDIRAIEPGICCCERNLFEEAFHNRVQSSGTDILAAFVNLPSNLCETLNAFFGKGDSDSLGC